MPEIFPELKLFVQQIEAENQFTRRATLKIQNLKSKIQNFLRRVILKYTKILQRLSLFLMALLVTGLLAACGDATNTPAGTSATTAATSATTAAMTTAATSATTAAMTSAAAMTTAATATTPATATTAATSATTAATSATTAAGTATTVAAGGTTTAAAAPAPTATPYPTIAQAAGSTKVTFWHGFSGFNAGVLQQVVNKFNSSQTKYYVEAIAQGGDYDATFNKFNTTLAGGNLPNLIQMFDIGTQRMIDSKKIVPMQDLIDKEKLDIISDLEPAVARYYTVNNKLYSMPLNSSAPVMYFDKNAFKEVGLDPTKTQWDV